MEKLGLIVGFLGRVYSQRSILTVGLDPSASSLRSLVYGKRPQQPIGAEMQLPIYRTTNIPPSHQRSLVEEREGGQQIFQTRRLASFLFPLLGLSFLSNCRLRIPHVIINIYVKSRKQKEKEEEKDTRIERLRES